MVCLFSAKSRGSNMRALWNGALEEETILHMRVTVVEVDATQSILFQCASDQKSLIRLDWRPCDPIFELKTQFAFFNFQVRQVGDEWQLSRLPSTSFVKLQEAPSYDSVLEPCCGMGGMTMGAKELGLRVIAAMDISPLSVATWRENHGFQIMQGNVLDGYDLANFVAMTGGKRAGLLCGFPCPPFSAFGDRKGLLDARSDVLIQILNLAFLMDCPFVILECTQHTAKFPGVSDLLDTFAQVMNFVSRTKVLHLERTWPSNRARWWAVFVSQQVGPCFPELCDLPVHPELQQISAVIPEWPAWEPADILLLDWHDFEEKAYMSLIQEEDAILDLRGVCPTLLHSAGHHFFPCPCGCRSQGLSMQRLARDGVSTVAVRSSTAGYKLRHLHPQEAGYLCGVKPNFTYPKNDLRAGLPLVGQIASPIQCHWIVAQMLEALQAADVINSDTMVVKEDLHERLLSQLVHLRLHAWPLESMNIPRILTLKLPEEVELHVKIDGKTQVRALVHAHRELLGWGSRISLFHDGVRLQDDFWLHALTYDAKEWSPHHLQQPTMNDCEITFTLGSSLLSCERSPGTFLFQVLRDLDLTYDMLGDASDLPAPGDRLSQSHVFDLKGAGHMGPGLSAIDIENEAELIFEQCRDSRVHLFPVLRLAELLEKPRVVLAFQIKRYMEQLFSSGQAPARIFLVVCADNHWFLFEYDSLTNQAATFDGIPQVTSLKYFLAQIFADIYGHSVCLLPDRSLLTQREDDICGVISLVNLGWRLQMWADFQYAEAISWANALRPLKAPTGAGNSDYGTSIAWLQQFLPSRGVPEERVAERAANAVKKLGLAAVTKATQSENPWKSLKQLGSNASRPFLWVQHDELKEHISRRASQRFGAAGPPRKQKKSKSFEDKKTIMEIPAEHLTIPTGVFIDEKNAPLSFLGLDAVKADCRGVTIATSDQAARFVQDSKKLTTEALGMLTTVELPLPLPGNLVIENVCWPALYGEEALLIKGSLIQLGDLRASIKTGPQAQNTAIQTALLRLQLYRDQTTYEWTAFIKGPIKMMTTQIAPLPRLWCSMWQIPPSGG